MERPGKVIQEEKNINKSTDALENIAAGDVQRKEAERWAKST